MFPLRIVDAFTEKPFAGNPAAVCVLPEAAGQDWMQAVASEMNLSETAFLHPGTDGFHLRWFTPVAEVDLCGHATLASAHVLWEDEHLGAEDEARFFTRSGLLTARRSGEKIEMDFPAEPAVEAEVPEAIPTALGLTPLWTGLNRLDYLVLVDSEKTLRDLAPDMGEIRKLAARGLIVTAVADDGPYDFVSRYFAPGFGIDEDPVTGSAHCALAPFWAKRIGQSDLTGYQASERGGVVDVEVVGERVRLGGHAVTTLRGELLSNPAGRPGESADFEDLPDYAALDASVENGEFLIFKHSTACVTSARAYREVRKYLDGGADVPVFLVDVLKQRELSSQIAERFGVRHESPQAILVRDGVATWNASHFKITRRALDREAGRRLA